MTSTAGVRVFSLGDAGDVSVECHRDGVRLADIAPAEGWRVAHRFPDGWFAKRKPATGAGVTLRNGSAHDTTAEAELEIARLDDGRWEIAQRRSNNTVRLNAVTVRCATPRLEWDGRTLSIADTEPAAGWRVERLDGPMELDGSWELVVVWTTGDADIELVVHCSAGEDPVGFGLVEVDERERVSSLP